MRALVAALAVASLVPVVTACRPAREARRVGLRMTGSPANATVTIDDIFVGRLDAVAARGVGLPPGTHHVTVEAAGYFPFDQRIEAVEGAGPVRLEAKLVPIPD